MQSAVREPLCPTCGYNLTGLPTRGICPECGRSFDLALLSVRRRKPWLGWCSLALPPATIIAVEVVAAFFGQVGSMIASGLLAFIGLIWPCVLAVRLANWRHHTRCADAIERFRRPPRDETRVALMVALIFTLLVVDLCALFVGGQIVIWMADEGLI